MPKVGSVSRTYNILAIDTPRSTTSSNSIEVGAKGEIISDSLRNVAEASFV